MFAFSHSHPKIKKNYSQKSCNKKLTHKYKELHQSYSKDVVVTHKVQKILRKKVEKQS